MGLDEFVIFSEPVILPIVALDMLVKLVSGVLMFCAFTVFRPTIANMPIMAQEGELLKLIVFHSLPLSSSI